MKMKHLGVLLACAGFFTACSQSGFTPSEHGFSYKIHTSNVGEKIKEGDSVYFKVIVKSDNDSVWYSSYKTGKQESVLMNHPGSSDNDVIKALALLSKGDSATIKVPIDSMLKYMPIDPFLQNYIDKNRPVIYSLKVDTIVTKASLAAVKASKDAAQLLIDSVAIDAYVASKKIKAITTPSGLRHFTTRAGTGEHASLGDTVLLHYKGTLLNGTVFDSSYERKQAADFPVVAGKTIPGFFEGLQLVQKGSKITLIMPSTLAYGAASQNSIPANSPLVFNLEILEIKRKK